MPLSARTVAAVITFLVLWVAWCFFAVAKLTPWVELHLTLWRWVTAWILCLLPLAIFGTVLAVKARKNRL